MNIEQFESELEDILSLLDAFSEVDDRMTFVDSVKTFKESAIMISNNGLVIKLSDKSEWQLTIVKTK